MAKNIVICCDGTGQYGEEQKLTNVARLFTILDLHDPYQQIACYDPGVGTFPGPEVKRAVNRDDRNGLDKGVVEIKPVTEPPTGILRFIHLVKGLSVGSGLFENVQEIYEVLIDNYEEGDRIFLFGFSRGAFTVRALAGLICRCGLLKKEERGRYREAFALYDDRHIEGLANDKRKVFEDEIASFKNEYAQPVEVKICFVGIWDTVKSVGYFKPKSMPHTRYNPIVETVRHALSIGEARSFFIHTTWGGIDSDDKRQREGIGKQDVKEVWFAGNHSDVGGGYKEEESSFAKISLRWMVEEATNPERDWKLLIDKTAYKELFVQHEKLPPNAPNEPHDELKGWSMSAIMWRALEWVPRRELRNDPPPPRRMWKWGRSGPRSIGMSRRNGEVLIDSHAREIYGTRAHPPWSDVDPKIGPDPKSKAKYIEFTMRFVDTAGGTADGQERETAYVRLPPEVFTDFPLLDRLLEGHSERLGNDFSIYRNHCYRVINFCIALHGDQKPIDETVMEKIVIATAFHDIGIWTDETFDYLEPSQKLACEYLEEENKSPWIPEIEAMIDNHHKLMPYRHHPEWLVERFRRADVVDVSNGWRRFGLSRALVSEVLATFPNTGFHRLLWELTKRRWKSHPLSPLPVIKL